MAAGRSVISGTRIAHGRYARVPSLASRRTCQSGWEVQALDDGQRPVQIGGEEPPDREFSGEPRRQLGEQRQAVLEVAGPR